MFLRDGVELSRQTMLRLDGGLSRVSMEPIWSGHVPADSAIAGDPEPTTPPVPGATGLITGSHDDGPASGSTWATTIILFSSTTTRRTGAVMDRSGCWRTSELGLSSIRRLFCLRPDPRPRHRGGRAAWPTRGENSTRRKAPTQNDLMGHWPGSDGSTRSSVRSRRADRKNDRVESARSGSRWMPRSGGQLSEERSGIQSRDRSNRGPPDGRVRRMVLETAQPCMRGPRN